MQLEPQQLKRLLVEPGHLSQEQLTAAVKEANGQTPEALDIIVAKGWLKSDQVSQLVANEMGFPFIDLGQVAVDEGVLQEVPETVARSRQVIAFARTPEGVKVGLTEPDDLEIRHALEKRFGQPVLPYLISKQDWLTAMSWYHQELPATFNQILSTLEKPDLTREEKDQATVEMVDTLLRYGQEQGVSDIHLEPLEDCLVVRFRIDGLLHDVLKIPREYEPLILTRIKIMAQIRTDEHRAAQDGRLEQEINGEKTDFRVSIVPVTLGENVVLRLLASTNRQLSLIDLGLAERDRSLVERAMTMATGLILATGPTGSGKTTTLYAIIKDLNKRDVHISTIEDPVEYSIAGVDQIQVNPKTNLTFAQGLRAIVRQDPDIIMVGEIRDEETTRIAINSALTGHLVLSTLHTNDAATTLPRLLDMGAEPFLVASTVSVAIGQRLVRKICSACRVSELVTPEIKKLIQREQLLKEILHRLRPGAIDSLRLYRGLGCPVCAKTGFDGRVGVFEVLRMSERVKELIIKRASSGEIARVARAEGMTTMLEDGIVKALQGITTFEEVLRVVNE